MPVRTEIKSDVMTVYVDEPLFFNVSGFESAAMQAVSNTLADSKKDFELSIKTFDSKPAINSSLSKQQGQIVGRAWINDENYARLNFGTKDHVVGKSGKLMAFEGFELGYSKEEWKGIKRKTHVKVYKSKTAVGRLAAKAGYSWPGTQPIVRRGPWKVSGIEPRKFDEQIVAKNAPKFEKRVSDATVAALKK